MADFFSVIVKAGKPEEVKIPFGMNIVLNNAAILGKDKESASLYLENQGEKILLCTLIAGVIPQYSMEILVNPTLAPIDSDKEDEEDEKKKKKDDSEDEEDEEDEEDFGVVPAKLIVEGKGEIHVTGVFVEDEPDEYDDDDYYDDEDMDDSEMEDDEDEEDEDDEDEEVLPPPAKKPALTPKKEETKPVKKEAPKSAKKEEPKKVETPKK